MMQYNLKKRLPSIDLARTFAIFCVIVTHATEQVYDLFGTSLFHAKISVLAPAVALHAFGRLGVPVFMYLSGYLLLDRDYTKEKRISFWKKNMAGLFLTTEIWIVLYYFFLLWLNNGTFSAGKLIRQMLFFESSSINHLWYMGMIIGIYLFLPFLSDVVRRLDRKSLLFLLLVSCFFTLVTPTWNVFRQISGAESLSPWLDVSFSGGWPGILLVLGWMIKKGYFDHLNRWVLVLTGILSWVGVILLDIYAYRNEVKYDIWYDSIFIVLAALSFTILFLRKREMRHSGVVICLGYSSFAVYLIHNAFIQLMAKKAGQIPGILTIPPLFRVFLMVLIAWGISLLLVYVISRNHKLAKALFFMR